MGHLLIGNMSGCLIGRISIVYGWTGNMDYTILIGIDIGLSGGIAFFDYQSGEVVSLKSMPTLDTVSKSGKNKKVVDLGRLKFILEIPHLRNEKTLVVMENVHAFPGQGSVATASLMEQKGIIRGLCSGLGYDELLVEPRGWQKFYDLIPPKDLKGKSSSQTKALRKKWLKEHSLEKARSLFPEWENQLSPITAHGLSDALLIGNWNIKSLPK